jgi:hypothetical protein
LFRYFSDVLSSAVAAATCISSLLLYQRHDKLFSFKATLASSLHSTISEQLEVSFYFQLRANNFLWKLNFFLAPSN